MTPLDSLEAVFEPKSLESDALIGFSSRKRRVSFRSRRFRAKISKTHVSRFALDYSANEPKYIVKFGEIRDLIFYHHSRKPVKKNEETVV